MAKQTLNHSLFARVTHWFNAVMIGFLSSTGLYISDPEAFPLFATMDLARKIHFIAMYLLIFGMVIRLYYSLISKDIRDFQLQPRDLKLFPGVVKYYLFMSSTLPKAGKYNPGQKLVYNLWFIMILIQIYTGFLLYFPESLGNYIRLTGGPVFIRQTHSLTAWIVIITAAWHVYLALGSGWSTVKSMFIGVKRKKNKIDEFAA